MYRVHVGVAGIEVVGLRPKRDVPAVARQVRDAAGAVGGNAGGRGRRKLDGAGGDILDVDLAPAGGDGETRLPEPEVNATRDPSAETLGALKFPPKSLLTPRAVRAQHRQRTGAVLRADGHREQRDQCRESAQTAARPTPRFTTARRLWRR